MSKKLNVPLDSMEMELALIKCGIEFPPSITKIVRGGVYYYGSYWFDIDITLTCEGVVKFRKLRRILRKYKNEFKQIKKESEFYRNINNNY